jgi:hypothetical protein
MSEPIKVADVTVDNVTATGKVMIGAIDVGQTLTELVVATGAQPQPHFGPQAIKPGVSPFWQWVQSIGFVTQSAHFFSAWAIVMTAAQWLPWWGSALGFLAYTSVKELVIDRVSWGENHGKCDWTDWWFNILGIVAALIVMGLK